MRYARSIFHNRASRLTGKLAVWARPSKAGVSTKAEGPCRAMHELCFCFNGEKQTTLVWSSNPNSSRLPGNAFPDLNRAPGHSLLDPPSPTTTSIGSVRVPNCGRWGRNSNIATFLRRNPVETDDRSNIESTFLPEFGSNGSKPPFRDKLLQHSRRDQLFGHFNLPRA